MIVSIYETEYLSQKMNTNPGKRSFWASTQMGSHIRIDHIKKVNKDYFLYRPKKVFSLVANLNFAVRGLVRESLRGIRTTLVRSDHLPSLTTEIHSVSVLTDGFCINQCQLQEPSKSTVPLVPQKHASRELLLTDLRGFKLKLPELYSSTL